MADQYENVLVESFDAANYGLRLSGNDMDIMELNLTGI